MGAPTLEERIFAPRQVLGWTLFALAAGFVNASAVMASRSVVSHVTGNVTALAAEGSLASGYAVVVAMFVGGAMVAVLFAETLKSKPKVAFALPVLASFAMLIGIAVAGKAGCFGAFGAGGEAGRSAFVMLGLLAASMGMVNASIAVATENRIRITHLTGPLTDLAGNIVRATLGAGGDNRADLRWGTLRLVKLLAFAIGAAVAAKISGTLHYDVFAVAGLILIAALGFSGAPEPVPTATNDGDPAE